MKSSIALAMLPVFLASAAAAEPKEPALPEVEPLKASLVEAPCDSDPALMAAFQSVQTLRAAFEDRKEMDLLDRPLLSRGHVYYQRPDRLHLATESPGRQTVTLVGSKVRIVQKDLGRSQSMDLSASEIAKAIVSSLMLALGGRVDALLPLYRCQAAVAEGGWRLSLTPREATLARVVERLQVRIRHDGALREVRVDEVDGDASVMTFVDPVLNVPFTPDEEKAYFSP
jgi:hypothetical protein